jgi:hypothetical protein
MIHGICPNLGIAPFSSRDKRQVTSYSLMTCNPFPVTGLAFGLPQSTWGLLCFLTLYLATQHFRLRLPFDSFLDVGGQAPGPLFPIKERENASPQTNQCGTPLV